MSYLLWDKKTISDFSDANINALYNKGYLFTREGKGAMCQTRSLRIDLSKFRESSENRRVLRKTEALALAVKKLPIADYRWPIGKLAKDFYDSKFGPGTFSANKIKELLTDQTKSNFNCVFEYRISDAAEPVGYAIVRETNELSHYAYPFYNLFPFPLPLLPNTGLGMMLIAVLWAKDQGKKYVYLGSFQRPADTYKLQFAGLEWWGGAGWNQDLARLKI